MHVLLKTPLRSLRSRQNRPATREQASVRTVVLVLAAFFLGLGGALWYSHHGKSAGAAVGESSGELSAATQAILTGLQSPITIHFYAILDPKSVSPETQAFAGRVDRLLAEYQAAADGKINVIRYTAESENGPQAAMADGLKPFNLAQGDACFLGVTVLGNDQKETLGQLSPAWEAALESDLSHAIARVSTPKPAPGVAAFTPAPDQTAIAAVKRALPNFTSLSVEEGTTILRESAMKEAQTALEAMKASVQAAQQQLAAARTGGSAAEQQAALKNLQQLQAEQAGKIQEITSRLQAEIEALKRLKAE